MRNNAFLILYLLFIWTYPGSGSRVFCGTCYEKQPCGVAFTNRAHVIWKLETWGLHMHKFPSVPVPMFCSFYTRDYFTHSLKTTQFLLFISRFILTHGTMNTLGATENDVHLLQLLNTSSLQSWSSVSLYLLFSDWSYQCGGVCSLQVNLFRTVFEHGGAMLPGNYAVRGWARVSGLVYTYCLLICV